MHVNGISMLTMRHCKKAGRFVGDDAWSLVSRRHEISAAVSTCTGAAVGPACAGGPLGMAPGRCIHRRHCHIRVARLHSHCGTWPCTGTSIMLQSDGSCRSGSFLSAACHAGSGGSGRVCAPEPEREREREGAPGLGPCRSALGGPCHHATMEAIVLTHPLSPCCRQPDTTFTA